MRLSHHRRTAVEEELAPRFARALDYVQRRVVEQVRTAATTLVASAGDGQDGHHAAVVAWGTLPLATPSASIDPAAVYDPMWWRRAYARNVAKPVDDFYSDIVDRASAELGVTLDPEDPAIADALDGLDDTAEAWGAGLADFVTGQVKAGLDAGDTVDTLASRLRDSEDSWFGLARSALMASVAVATTWNRATLAAGSSARAQGTSSTKEWLSAGDDRVRETHQEMDGQSVDIGDDFLVAGAYPAAGPHDERLPVEETANCRCVLVLSGDGGNVADESTDVADDGLGSLDYPTDGSEEDALVAGPVQLHTHGHCERCGGWLEGRSYCAKCGRGYTGPLLDAGTETPPADPQLEGEVHDQQLSPDTIEPNGDVGLVATDGVDQEDAVHMPTTAPGDVAAASTGTPTYATTGMATVVPTPADQVDSHPERSGRFADAGLGMVAWAGILAVEGRPTGDGRMFRNGALRWDENYLPADLFAMLQDPDGGGGHDGSTICGRIDRMWKTPSVDGSYTEIWGEGFYDINTPTGAEVFRLQQQGMLTGVSIDVDSVEVVMPDINSDQDLLDLLFGGGVEEYSAGRIRRATICSIPAFIEARILPVDSVGALVASAASEGCVEVRMWTPVENLAGQPRATLVASANAYPARPTVREADVFHSALVDSDPPADVFARQEYRQYTPFEVSADGRVQGHVSPWGECHIGFSDRCVTAPRSRCGYAHARTGHVLTAEGDLVPTARVFAQFGPGRRAHAPEELAAAPAVEWYESMTLAVADVAVYEDQWGIQIQGRVRPGITRNQLVALRASRISPDWRSINGSLECVGLAVVNVSGFTNTSRVPALVASAMEAGVELTLPAEGELSGAAFISGGEVLTLVASGGPSRDPAMALAQIVTGMAARLEALEQAELRRQVEALTADLPTEADEQAALAAQVAALVGDLDLTAETTEESTEEPEPTVGGLTAEELETLRAALSITERLSARPTDEDAAAGDMQTCPVCGQSGIAPDATECPHCGATLDGNADATAETVTASAEAPCGCEAECACKTGALVSA